MSKYKHILFDADGTLFDFKKAEKSSLKKTLESAGIEYNDSIADTYSSINKSLWEAFERGEIKSKQLRVERFARLFSIINCNKEPKEYAKMYIDNLALDSSLISGAKGIIKQLYGKCTLHIATNGISFVQRSRFALSGIYRFFDEIYISEEIGHPKPHKEFFDYIFEDLGIEDKSEVIIIGDTASSDIAGGINAGIATCYYNPKNIPLPEGMKATHEITELSQLKEIIL